ncbi:MAG: hypothetical protein NTV08_07355 [Verrucomicrobia bacterium]|nr:hypothetical protein [Verrucomicrobiota bacterium]
MDDTSPTQKQRAGLYAGNLGYFRKPHYLRRLRLWCFLATLILSLVTVVSYRYWKRDNLFSKGALSQGHARLAQDCRACHTGAQTDALKARLSESKDARSIPGIVKTIFSTKNPGNGSPHAHTAAFPAMDQACLSCHPAFGLHLPQSSDLKLHAVAAESVSVRAENCLVCHREHMGSARMALPDAAQCAACHNNPAELSHHRQSQALSNPPVKATGENRNLGDGLITFITQSDVKRNPVAFSDFAHGHPPFGYEAAGLSDPAKIKFNHWKHLKPDLSGAGKDRTLACTDCHLPGPGGNFKQPVAYEQHCKQCHTLQILPNLPNLHIPHRDAEKVRWFLASVRIPIENALRAEGVTDPGVLAKRADTEMDGLRIRSKSLALPDLEQRVFFEGDPKDDPDVRRMRAGNAKFLTECAKCHDVTPASVDRAPEITPPNMAMRWLQKGQFNHQPHGHMQCAECHAAAKNSKLTSDILLPTQKSCAECHRAPDAKTPPITHGKTDAHATHTSAEFQRKFGGVKWDCQACHVFHAPSAATSAKPAH